MMDPSLFNSTPIDPLNTTDSLLCTCRLSNLACLTLVLSDCLPSCSLWRRCCSLAVALSSRSRRNLSLSFISVELHGEESFVAQNIKKLQHMCKFKMHVYLRFHSFNLNFRYLASCTQTDIHTAYLVHGSASEVNHSGADAQVISCPCYLVFHPFVEQLANRLLYQL